MIRLGHTVGGTGLPLAVVTVVVGDVQGVHVDGVLDSAAKAVT